MQNPDFSTERLLLTDRPADVHNLFRAHGLLSFAYFDRQLEQEARRAYGAWPLLARDMSRRLMAASSAAQVQEAA